MSNEEDDLSKLYRALSDVTRRRMIDVLAEREQQSLFEICGSIVTDYGISHSRQAFSKHLGILEQAGLIEVEWLGTTKLHTLNTRPLAQLQEGWISNFNERP